MTFDVPRPEAALAASQLLPAEAAIDTVQSWTLAPSPSGQRFWRWSPKSVSDLPGIRRALRAGLWSLPAHGGPELNDVLVLLLDEMLSNALRHGRTPVLAEVRRTARSWVLEVSDEAAAAPPQRAWNRDPAEGRMGLCIVEQLANAHGWFVTGTRKYVWASLPAI